MAFIQKNLPPPNKVFTFTVRNFVGGLNNRSTQLEDNQASDLLNMKFDDETIMAKRDGIDYYDALNLVNPITFIDEYRPYTGSAVLMRATDSALYAGTTKIADVTGKISARNYMGKYVFADGAKVRFYGTFQQTSDTHNAIVGTPVATPIVMELVTPPAGFTPLPSPNILGVWKYDYTNLKVWYEPCAAEIADTYKGGNVIPANVKYVEVHGDRLFLSGSTTDQANVYISDISNGFYFGAYLPIQLPPNGDVIKGLTVFSDSVVVGRQNDIHVIYGNTNRTDISSEVFRLKRINTHTGFASNDAVDIVNNFLFFLGFDGNIYSMVTTKTDVDNLSTTILSKNIDLLKAPISVTTADFSKASSTFLNDEWRLCIGDKVLIYSYRQRSFTLYKYYNVNMRCLYVKDYNLIMGASNGRILKPTPNVYSDLGYPYLAYWYSRSMDMNDPTSYKQFREFYLVANVFDTGTSTVNVNFEIDNVDVGDSFKLTNQNSIFGKTKFGDRFINRNIITSLPVIIGRRGRLLRFKLYNGYFITGTVTNVTDLNGYPNVKEGNLVLVTSTNTYYLYTNHEWVPQVSTDLFEPMKVFEVSGQYELRGKR